MHTVLSVIQTNNSVNISLTYIFPTHKQPKCSHVTSKPHVTLHCFISLHNTNYYIRTMPMGSPNENH